MQARYDDFENPSVSRQVDKHRRNLWGSHIDKPCQICEPQRKAADGRTHRGWHSLVGQASLHGFQSDLLGKFMVSVRTRMHVNNTSEHGLYTTYRYGRKLPLGITHIVPARIVSGEA